MISKNDNSNLIKSQKIYKELIKYNIDVLLDDTDENISAKIKKFNLIGIPYQIIIGQKSEGDLFEFEEIDKESQNLSLDKVVQKLTKEKNSI
jgi:prolyl-tRNA synthetase